MGRIKQILLILVVLIATIGLAVKPAVADCNDPSSCNGDQNCLSNLIETCRKSIADSQNQQKSLASDISLLNNRIALTRTQINLTEDKIGRLTSDISSVSGKITVIQGSLNSVTEILLNRIVETYKQGRNDELFFLLTSPNFSDLLQRFEYMRIVQKRDKERLIQMAATKKNYNDQKDLLEQKKVQVEALSAQLKAQKSQLDKQTKDKQQLLDATKNDEARYQSLLAQAQAQLEAFRNFVSGQGGLTLIDADPNWPKDYYSQRDRRWGGVAIAGYYSSPNNITSIGESGCLITSVAMTLTHRGNGQTPLAIGTNSSYFFDALFIWDGLRSLGFNTPVRTTDKSQIDNILNQGKWAIVGLSRSPSTYSSPFHFVVITEKRGDDYNLFDPWRGPNLSLNSNYGSDYITEIISY